tara:strand:- start:104 stop:1255 length:1152 start_codon:yes stop_codon:yes gene_type:complete
MVIGISTNYAYSQEIGLATFQESAQLIIDKKMSQNSIASITLLSTNTQEIKIPIELEEKIRESERIQAIVITNQNNCVTGVSDQSCILINIERNPNDKGINAIQESTKRIGDSFIDEINQMLNTDAKFFQVYIHTSDKANQELETSGVISGAGIISAVYTMPMQDTHYMYQKISTMLLSKEIRESKGFYNVARNLSIENNSKTSFTIIPSDSKLLLQLRLSVETPLENLTQMDETPTKINPLEFFKIKELSRSGYFSEGNYPLNSIFQIVIISNEETNASDINGNIIPTQNIDGIQIPTDITKKGWVFDPQKGQQIQGKYIFGENISINENELKFSLVNNNVQDKEIKSNNTTVESNESTVIVIIITIVSIAVAIFYLKGYKK